MNKFDVSFKGSFKEFLRMVLLIKKTFKEFQTEVLKCVVPSCKILLLRYFNAAKLHI